MGCVFYIVLVEICFGTCVFEIIWCIIFKLCSVHWMCYSCLRHVYDGFITVQKIICISIGHRQ